MTDDIRQEAVERAAAKYGDRRWVDMAGNAIDASGLIEQLTEAIAQRDEALDNREELALALDVAIHQRDDALTGLRNAVIRSSEAREQLATERALCDRLVTGLRGLHGCNDWTREHGAGFLNRAVADYDAHRATERET